MNELKVDPLILRKASLDVEDLLGRIRATFGEDEVRVSPKNLRSSGLSPKAEKAAESVEEARKLFAKRLEQHSEAISQASHAFEDTDSLHAQLMKPLNRRVEESGI